MSRETAGSAAPAGEQPPQETEQKQEEQAEAPEHKRQEAWAARRALIQHGPSFVMSLDRSASATQIGRDQFGVSGGNVHGDVNNYFGAAAEGPRHLSGPVRPEVLTELTAVFRGCPSFEEALARLRADRVVILSGGRDTGRRSAALMLLHRVTGGTLRTLDPPRSLSALTGRLERAEGYLLENFAAGPGDPVREPHLLGLRERLERSDAYLVITVEPSAALDDVPFVRWDPPPAEDMLHAHVTPRAGETGWQGLCGLTQVKEFLAGQHQPGVIREFAQRLIAVHRGESDARSLDGYSERAVEDQVSRWLTDEQRKLLDKAFLLSLAVFDKAPYAVAAELGDLLYARLQHTADPHERVVIPVFGVSREDRLRFAHARGHHDTEVTEWGAVGQYVAEFQDERTARTLLKTAWNLHPSSRPALVKWIGGLAEDRRPLVRTRAASATALLATADFSSAMAHLVEPWADDDDPNSWLTAANALTLAHLLEVPTVLPLLRDWCTGDMASRRWTAIRAYGLLGPVEPEETLDVLLDTIRGRRPDEEDELDESEQQFADALELLLLAVREPVLGRLAENLAGDRPVRGYVLLAFLKACGQTGEAHDRPLILDWYARAHAADESATARHLTVLWQALLSDRTRNDEALRTLAGWVRRADADPETESALTALLPAITAEPPNERRVGHLLRTLRDAAGSPSPSAARLLDHLSLS
ncbi:hypothetical protein [Streptomyces naphthomycinicus]|uniref:hypothetical protein n=1 Tax=Streptomyces naphthomycinicus TaxID=2872625 RepID=UPI001CED56BF|nr:hypothetical protein [Streptomyces sp. TML10]